MKAGYYQLRPFMVILIIYLCFYDSYQLTDLQVCKQCNGNIRNGTAVDWFCTQHSGLIDRRCCLKTDNASSPEYVIGLDLSNCSLSHVEHLQEAWTALIMDLSLNPIVNITDSVFQGFTDLNYLILPSNLDCPGGNASWDKVELKEGNRFCQGQKNLCNQTGQMSLNCPENSLCAPYGPGFYECNCADNHHGYKCLRKGEFPVIQVFGPLAASTVVVAFLLWGTQRRKVKTG